jgi:hypothetical protein
MSAQSWQNSLTPQDYDKLAESWCPRDLIDDAGICRVDSPTGAGLVGRHASRSNFAGLVIPYRLPGDIKDREYRLRRDEPDLERKSDGSLRERAKYLSPPGRGNKFYFAPNALPEWLTDISLPAVFVEGEKKCLASSRLAIHETKTPCFLPIGLPGVWGWRGSVGKARDAKGARRDVKGAVTDFDLFTWQGRTGYILFDTNVRTDDSVKAARRCLAQELKDRGAIVRFVELPEDFTGNGIDDFLYERGADAALALFDDADQMPKADPDASIRHRISNTHAAVNALLEVLGVDASLHKGVCILIDKARGVKPGEWQEFSDGEAGALLPGDVDVADASKAKRWQRFWIEFEAEQERIGKRLARRIPGKTVKDGRADKLHYIRSKYQTSLVQDIAEIERRVKTLTGRRTQKFKAAALKVAIGLPAYDPPDELAKVGKTSNNRPKKNRKRDRFLRAAREIMEEFLPYGSEVLEEKIIELHAELEELAATLRGRVVTNKERANKDDFSPEKHANAEQNRASVLDKSVQYAEPQNAPLRVAPHLALVTEKTSVETHGGEV